MPWKRAKALPPPSNTLFDACFRIHREASEAAGHHIPMVVENVKGAQPWVGRARAHYGPWFLWGDVPALMPIGSAVKQGGDWFGPGTDCLAPRWCSSRSSARKAASALLAKIPFSLAQHIAKVYKPEAANAA